MDSAGQRSSSNFTPERRSGDCRVGSWTRCSQRGHEIRDKSHAAFACNGSEVTQRCISSRAIYGCGGCGRYLGGFYA